MLKVYAFGNQPFMDKYSQGLTEDCEHYGYEKHFHIIDNGENFSYNNWQGINALVDLLRWECKADDRVLFTDPESRIHQAIPDKWIDTTKPVVAMKHYNDKAVEYKNEDKYTLWSKICLGPAILGPNDLPWLDMWLGLMKGASELDKKQCVPTELFFDAVMNYNHVERIETDIPYTRRDHTGTFEFVRGSYVMPETVVTHPNIHYLDYDLFISIPGFHDEPFMWKDLLHNHFQDLPSILTIDDLMSKEICDINKWPAGTELNDTWFHNDDWLFEPSTGRVKHKNFPTIKYHDSMIRKQELGIKTPAVEFYQNNRD